jgi:hypothetical protein
MATTLTFATQARFHNRLATKGRGMTFVILLIGCSFVGYLAQSQKGRAGFLWGLGTLVLALPWWFVVTLASTTARNTGGLDGLSDGSVEFTSVLFVVAPPILVMGLGVLTLPSKKTPARTD